jgi:hypothetical protein
MSAMTVSAGLPFGRPLTVDDLEAMPDDGHSDTAEEPARRARHGRRGALAFDLAR